MQAAALAALHGIDPDAYLRADRDDALIVRAVAQTAVHLYAEQRRQEIEIEGQIIAREVAKLFAR